MKAKAGNLNQADYDEIERRIDEKIIARTSNLPTKDEFFNKMDEVLGEVRGMREEFAAHQVRHDRGDSDVKTLKHQVKHLYKTFEIAEPVDPAY